MNIYVDKLTHNILQQNNQTKRKAR